MERVSMHPIKGPTVTIIGTMVMVVVLAIQAIIRTKEYVNMSTPHQTTTANHPKKQINCWKQHHCQQKQAD